MDVFVIVAVAAVVGWYGWKKGWFAGLFSKD